MNGSMIAVGDGSHGLNLVDVQAAGDDTFNSLVAFATTSYNTGWQYGNIKGTFLSDTDTTNATDSNVVTNGTFDSNTSSWSEILEHQFLGILVVLLLLIMVAVQMIIHLHIQQTGILVSSAKYRITGRVQPSMSGIMNLE